MAAEIKVMVPNLHCKCTNTPCVSYSHKAAHHLFGVLGASGVGEADERTVDCDPRTPLKLQHKHITHDTQVICAPVLRL